MGVDITGWVEVKETDKTHRTAWYRWEGAINIRAIAGRNYRMFALLFDVRNHLNVPAPFARRGIPEDRSFPVWATLRYDIEDESDQQILSSAIRASWLTWREIQSLPWDGEISEMDTRVSVDWSKLGADTSYEYTDWENHPEYKGFEIIRRRKMDDPTAFWETFYRAKEVHIHPEMMREALSYHAPGGPMVVHLGAPQGVFQLRPATWRDQQDNGWDMLFKLMATLAEKYGDDNVRLVAWFDQL